jgi:hypothetical protein
MSQLVKSSEDNETKMGIWGANSEEGTENTD